MAIFIYSYVLDYPIDRRTRSASTGSALPEVLEDAPLISVGQYPTTSDREFSDDGGYTGKFDQRSHNSNFLTVPTPNPDVRSSTQSLLLAGESVASLGEGSDGESLMDRSCVSPSNISTVSRIEGRTGEDWVADTPWLKVTILQTCRV